MSFFILLVYLPILWWRGRVCYIPDNYEKIVLSMDWDYISSYDGIRFLCLIDWLLV